MHVKFKEYSAIVNARCVTALTRNRREPLEIRHLGSRAHVFVHCPRLPQRLMPDVFPIVYAFEMNLTNCIVRAFARFGEGVA